MVSIPVKAQYQISMPIWSDIYLLVIFVLNYMVEMNKLPVTSVQYVFLSYMYLDFLTLILPGSLILYVDIRSCDPGCQREADDPDSQVMCHHERLYM